MATKAKKSTKSPLDERKMIRCTSDDWARWEALARELGYNGAGPLLRKLGNDAIAALPKGQRDKIEAAARG